MFGRWGRRGLDLVMASALSCPNCRAKRCKSDLLAIHICGRVKFAAPRAAFRTYPADHLMRGQYAARATSARIPRLTSGAGGHPDVELAGASGAIGHEEERFHLAVEGRLLLG